MGCCYSTSRESSLIDGYGGDDNQQIRRNVEVQSGQSRENINVQSQNVWTQSRPNPSTSSGEAQSQQTWQNQTVQPQSFWTPSRPNPSAFNDTKYIGEQHPGRNFSENVKKDRDSRRSTEDERVDNQLTRQMKRPRLHNSQDRSLSQQNISVNRNVNTNNIRANEPASSQFVLNIHGILSIPPMWSSKNLNKIEFVNLPFSSTEGIFVKQIFNRSYKSKDFTLQITGITRVENPFLHSLYQLKKEELASRNGHVDEIFLFHGTKRENLSNIFENNLNWRLLSKKHLFGKGVSFSPLATYSSHYCDNTDAKVMLLCKVLVSNVTQGSAEMSIPSEINGVTYDTSIKEDTRVIVKYCDNEFYPLYKIMCKSVVTENVGR